MNTESTNSRAIATLGGGCFWCLEAVYKDLKGVDQVVSGYAGGWVRNPTYQQVCSEDTGHAEVVQISFNPDVISYKELLEVFFTIHDPTTLNRQGNDVGPQYRSIILTENASQKADAEAVLKTSQNIWSKPIVTEIKSLEAFYPAEAYHQEYFERNRNQPYCQVVIAPKIAKFRKQYYEKLKK